MKKLFKIATVCVLSLAVLLVCGWVAFRIAYPDHKLKQMALEYTKKNWNREISFDRISFNWVGVTLENFALSEPTSFEQGTFLKADKLQAKVAFWPLLKKRVELDTVRVHGLDVTILQNADGTFNFDDFSSSEEQTENAEASQGPQELGFTLTAEHFIAQDCSFTYKDLAAGTTWGVSKLNFDIENFDLDEPFNTIITFTTTFKQKNAPAVDIPAKIDLTLFLAALDMQKAYVTLNQATASYQTVRLNINGKVESFTAPAVQLAGTISGVDSQVLTPFAPDLPSFTLPTINLAFAAQTDLEKSTAQITQAAVRLQDSAVSVTGPVTWGGNTPTYTLTGKAEIDLDQAVQMTDTGDFRPTGTVTGSFKATEKKDFQDLSGTFQIKNLRLMYDPFTISETNGTVKITSLDDISSNNLTGLLNGEKFNLSFGYKQIKDTADITLNADIAKLTLARLPGSTDTAAQPAEQKTAEGDQTATDGQPAAAAQTAAQTQPAQATPESFFNLKSNVKIGAVSIPYFRSDGVTLTTTLTGLSASMNKANGQVSFAMQPGAITDMDTLIKGNKIVKFILLPLGIINSVAKKLNISLFNATSDARKGEIAFTDAQGEYTFKNGLMTINNTTFISSLTNVKGTGTINFPTNALDMKVSATLLTKQTPMVIKIGGTLDNPSGKLDVLNTVGSVVGGLLNYKTATGLATGSVKTAGNVAGGAAKTTGKAAGTVAKTGVAAAKETADAAKATVKAIGGLFKKKSGSDSSNESGDTSADSTAADTAAAAE